MRTLDPAAGLSRFAEVRQGQAIAAATAQEPEPEAEAGL
jgi:hypothetical protein